MSLPQRHEPGRPWPGLAAPVEIVPSPELRVPTLNADSLAELRLFKDLSAEGLATLSRAASVVTFSAGRSVNPPKGYTLVTLSGEVECSIRDAAEKPFILSVQGPGSIFGELSRLSASEPHDEKVTLSAKDNVHGVTLPDQVFDDLVFSNPSACRELAHQLAQRLLAMNRFAKVAVDVAIDPSEMHPDKLSDRAAAILTRSVGSWGFVGGALLFVGAWGAWNTISVTKGLRFDEFPFVALNTAFSLMSAFTGSIILIAQNYRDKVDNSVIQVMRQVLLGVATKISGIARNQSKQAKRLDEIEATLRKLSSQATTGENPPKAVTSDPEHRADAASPSDDR